MRRHQSIPSSRSTTPESNKSTEAKMSACSMCYEKTSPSKTPTGAAVARAALLQPLLRTDQRQRRVVNGQRLVVEPHFARHPADDMLARRDVRKKEGATHFLI